MRTLLLCPVRNLTSTTECLSSNGKTLLPCPRLRTVCSQKERHHCRCAMQSSRPRLGAPAGQGRATARGSLDGPQTTAARRLPSQLQKELAPPPSPTTTAPPTPPPRTPPLPPENRNVCEAFSATIEQGP